MNDNIGDISEREPTSLVYDICSTYLEDIGEVQNAEHWLLSSIYEHSYYQIISLTEKWGVLKIFPIQFIKNIISLGHLYSMYSHTVYSTLLQTRGMSYIVSRRQPVEHSD